MAFRALLVSGSLRARSTNTAALRTILSLLPPELSGTFYEGLSSLPPFNPDRDGDALPDDVTKLRADIHDADALVFSTPEYAGALPGSLKNLLDWTIGDEGDGSLYGKPVAWLNVSARGALGAHGEMRTVLGFAHATVVSEACIDAPVAQAMIGVDGLVADPGTLRLFSAMVDELVGALHRPGA